METVLKKVDFAKLHGSQWGWFDLINTKFAQPFHNASVSKVCMNVYDPKWEKGTTMSKSDVGHLTPNQTEDLRYTHSSI